MTIPNKTDRKRKLKNRIDNEDSKKMKITLEPFESKHKNINSINCLINIAEEWIEYENKLNERKIEIFKIKHLKKKYNTILENNDDYYKISKIVEELKCIRDLIGMDYLKQQIVDQILFFAQGLNSGEMMHTVIYGDQGCGKSTVAQILGRMYKKIGFLSKDIFRTAGRSDLIGEYLGSTAIKTKKLLQSCKGGVLFIDEAYALGNKEKRDSFSKEAIDTLNQFLSENTEDFLCIIAGYEQELKQCFFSFNPGLERRFPWKFELKKYQPSELRDIILYQISENQWSYEGEDVPTFILNVVEKNKQLFTENGGDCLILFDKCKISHSRRVFGQSSDTKFILNKEDIENGMKSFVLYKNEKKPKKNDSIKMLYL